MARKFICTQDYPIACTADGKLKGFELDGICTFHGIRYAVAKRFQPAGPVKPWQGVQEAVNYGPVCPTDDNSVPAGDILTPHRYWPQDENCQYLNIWTKSLEPSAKRPVMVWLHGGGFSDGSSLEQTAYEGDALCRYGDVVVVTLNHRLNILGYLDLSAYSKRYDNSVNAGITDLVEALKWVQRNIHAFGGDPDNVTIFGQSGGGGKAYTLLQTPAAAGLFHKAIIMSGTDHCDRSLDHAPIVREMMNILRFPANRADLLETAPYPVLMRTYRQAAHRTGSAINWGPVPNGYFLGHPLDVGFSEYARQVPLMVGTVIAEFGGFMGAELSPASPEAEKRRVIDKVFGGRSAELVQLFQQAYPNTDISVLPKLDARVRPAALAFMDKRLECAPTAPGYLYLFALSFDINGGLPAWHCSDIPFVFHNTTRVACANIEGVTDRLEAEMAGAAASFAKTGDPNHNALPNWVPYTQNGRETMVFDRRTALRKNHDVRLLAAVNGLLPGTEEFVMPLPKLSEEELHPWFS